MQHAGQLASRISAVAGAGVVFSAAVRMIADGRPVSCSRLARELGWSREELDTVLVRFPDIERDVEGALVGFALTLRSTAHAFELDGRRLFTWCAFDALFLPVVLGRPAWVESSCPATRTRVRLRVSPARVEDCEPSDVVLSFVRLCETDELRGSFCNNVSFYASAGVAHDWLCAHPSASVVSVAAAFEAGRDFARRLDTGKFPAASDI